MKTYKVYSSETVFYTHEVQAKDGEEARELVVEQDFDFQSADDFSGWQVDKVEEVNTCICIDNKLVKNCTAELHDF